MRDRGTQPLPLSPLRASNRTGGGAAAADAVGSSTKDRGWQQQQLGSTSRPSRMRPAAPQTDNIDKKKSKKIEGTMMVAEAATKPAPLSRIPARSSPTSARSQPGAPGTGGGSRIPRPPAFGTAQSAGDGSSSPQPDYAAMLATPVAPAQLKELHQTQQQQGQPWGELSGRAVASEIEGAALQGFHAYSNPSFDGAEFLAGTHEHSPTLSAGGSCATDECSNSLEAASHDFEGPPVITSRLFVNGVAEIEAEAAAGRLTPGLVKPAERLTPPTERSLEAWLCASPVSIAAPVAGSRGAGAGTASQPLVQARSDMGIHLTRGTSSGTTAGHPNKGPSQGRAMPTPEAWQLLQHINDDSPAAAPKGVRGIMNAYLRTGPQMLSPEPACADVIRAPCPAAVPASGLLNVAGPGGVGVYGMVNAYLRTGASMLSPEPGMEGHVQQQPQAPAGATAAAVPLHPYSPASPLAATPADPQLAASAAAAGDLSAGAQFSPTATRRRPISPSSVCSNGEVGSSGPAESISLGGGLPAAVPLPRLNLGTLAERQASEGTEVSFGAALAGARADSPGSGELPTARFFAKDSPDVGQCQQAQNIQVESVAAQRQRHRAPSPITFRLPNDSPGEDAQPAASQVPSFSFGMAPPQAASAEGSCEADGGEELPQSSQLDGEQQAGAAGQLATSAVPGPVAVSAMVEAEQAAAPGQQHVPGICSGETVQQAHPFKAMLRHLQGPQYASPARFAAGPRPDSPQSPQQCTPLHLISTLDAPSASPGAVVATPAPGRGSMTVWLDRRGLRGALTTPARNDLRLLWAAAHDVALFQSEAAALRADNAVLAEELEEMQRALRQLGAEHDAAVVAAEAGALCAEAEVARARDAATHMMRLADQIQGMFALCESEKAALVCELEAAQRQLTASEAAANGTVHLGDRQPEELQQQLDEARQAVGAAQQAADAAQRRAGDAAAELESIRRQLHEAQQQLASARNGSELTPVTKLRCQLGNMHDSLAQLHAEQCSGRLPAASPELDQLVEASRGHLAQLERLLGGGNASALRRENERLHRCLAQARTLLAMNSPAAAPNSDGAITAAAQPGSEAAAVLEQRRSPLPFALLRRSGSEEEGGSNAFSPATTFTLAAGSPDVFSSPYLASHTTTTTLTVDYRDLHGSVRNLRREADSASSCGFSPASSASSSRAAASRSPLSDEVAEASSSKLPAPCSPSSATGSDWHQNVVDSRSEGLEFKESPHEDAAGLGVGIEAEYTVVHGGMVITHVPASQVSKVQSMVQYWEAVASGTPLAAGGVSAEEMVAAEAYASAAVAAAQAAMAAAEHHGQPAAEAACLEGAVEERRCAAAGELAAVAADSGEQQQLEQGEGATPQAQQSVPAGALQSTMGGQTSSHSLPGPAAMPGSFSRHLPAGHAATPLSRPGSAGMEDGVGAATPQRSTPLNFLSAPPPTPATASIADAYQAQQLQHLTISRAATAAAGQHSPAEFTPASAQRTASQLPGTPAGTPVSSTVAVAVTPLALSALRARMGGSGSGVQDAVRNRLARLKVDLQAAQAKLATVDQGLASIAFTPTSSITASSTPGSRSSSLLRRTPLTPPTGGALGSPIAASGGVDHADVSFSPSPQQQQLSFGSSSQAAALIAGGSSSPLALAPGDTASPAVSQGKHAATPATTAALVAASEAATAHQPASAIAEIAAPVRVAAATAVGECTPPVTRRSVRFADTVQAGSSRRAIVRVGTPHSKAAAVPGSDDQGGMSGMDETETAASPVVASSRRCPAGGGGGRGAALQRSPLAAAQSAAKPGLVVRRFGLGLEQAEDDSEASSSSEEVSELLFDASRMAQAGIYPAATPPPHWSDLDAGTTPMAHPEQHTGSCVASAAAAATPNTATSVLSTSSISPPRPLLLMAVRPLGRAQRRGAVVRGGGVGTGRRRSEAEEREFRRRAAALNIQVSPYFRRPRSLQAGDAQ